MPKTEPQVQTYTPPPEPSFERQSARPGVMTVMYPAVIGGVCEFHGVIDHNLASIEQYKLCPNDGKHPHYNMIRCSYCPETKDPNDVIYKSKMTIMRNPDNWSKLIAVCDNFTCLQAHEQRFKA